jgi:DNA-binding MarR family transcriptional regulator
MNRQFTALKHLAKNENQGYAPLSRSELGARMGITRVSAHLLINKLEKAGFVTRVPGTWRNVYLTQAGWTVWRRI